MADNKQKAIQRAKKDLSKRLGIAETEITDSAENADFPDTSLGAPVKDEMSAQMITSGYRIRLNAAGKVYEYRADADDNLRLFQFKGANHKV